MVHLDLFHLQPFSTSFSVDKRVEPKCELLLFPLHGSGALNGQLLSKGHRKQARVELGCLGEKDLEDPKVTEVVRLCGSPPTEVPKGPAEQGRSDVPQAGLTAKGRFDSRQSWLSSRQGQ